MKVIPTALPGVLILEPKVFGDARGFFLESFNQQDVRRRRRRADVEFVQDNHSRSAKGVLRGLHFQLPPHAQGKLVRVTQRPRCSTSPSTSGAASPTFGRWVGVELDADEPAPALDPAGLRARLPGPERQRRLPLQDHRLLRAGGTSSRSAGTTPRSRIEWPDIGMPFALAARDRDAPLLDERPPIE